MKKNLMCLVVLGLVLTAYSQEPFTYNVELHYVYELEFDNIVYSENKSQMSMTIYDNSIVTKTDIDEVTERIVETRIEEGNITYTLANTEIGLIWLTIEGDIIKMKLEADPKKLYVYKITSEVG